MEEIFVFVWGGFCIVFVVCVEILSVLVMEFFFWIWWWVLVCFSELVLLVGILVGLLVGVVVVFFILFLVVVLWVDLLICDRLLCWFVVMVLEWYELIFLFCFLLLWCWDWCWIGVVNCLGLCYLRFIWWSF